MSNLEQEDIKRMILSNPRSRMAINNLRDIPPWVRRPLVMLHAIPLFAESMGGALSAGWACWTATMSLMWQNHEDDDGAEQEEETYPE